VLQVVRFEDRAEGGYPARGNKDIFESCFGGASTPTNWRLDPRRGKRQANHPTFGSARTPSLHAGACRFPLTTSTGLPKKEKRIRTSNGAAPSHCDTTLTPLGLQVLEAPVPDEQQLKHRFWISPRSYWDGRLITRASSHVSPDLERLSPASGPQSFSLIPCAPRNGRVPTEF